MSWKIALVVALITALTTAIVTAPVADKITRMHSVSDFEGGRGMLIAFILVPAGLIGGFLLGLLGTKLAHATEWAHFWKAAGLAIGLGQVALFGIAGLSALSIPRPPLIDGNGLSLEIEVHVPLELVSPKAREPDQIRLSVYAGPKDNHYAQIDRSLFREQDGRLIVTAVAGLHTRSYMRTASFHIEDHTWLAADIDLPASPGEEHTAWSGLKPMRQASTSGADAVPTDVLVRYRVIDAPTP